MADGRNGIQWSEGDVSGRLHPVPLDSPPAEAECPDWLKTFMNQALNIVAKFEAATSEMNERR